jgi:hypothetical protein
MNFRGLAKPVLGNTNNERSACGGQGKPSGTAVSTMKEDVSRLLPLCSADGATAATSLLPLFGTLMTLQHWFLATLLPRLVPLQKLWLYLRRATKSYWATTVKTAK